SRRELRHRVGVAAQDITGLPLRIDEILAVDNERLMGTHVEDRGDGAAPDGVGLANSGHAVEVAAARPELHDPALIRRAPHLQLDLLTQLLIGAFAGLTVAGGDEERGHRGSEHSVGLSRPAGHPAAAGLHRFSGGPGTEMTDPTGEHLASPRSGGGSREVVLNRSARPRTRCSSWAP